MKRVAAINSSLTREIFLMKFCVLALMLLFQSQGVIAQSQSLKKVNFLPMWVPQPQFAGYYMAKEKGIYEKYGLDVNIINGSYGKDVMTFLKEGKADFGIMYLSAAIKNRGEGIELVNVGQIFQSNEIMFVAKKKSGINSLQDFSGKKIAVWRTILKELTVGFLNKQNIQAEVIPMNEGVNLFLKDAVDICAVMHYNEYNSLINFGIDPEELSVFYFRDYEMNFPEDGIYCMSKTYDNDPDLCKKFVQASIEGWEYAIKNPEESLRVLEVSQKLENVQSNMSHSRWMMHCMEGVLHPTGKNIKTGVLLEPDYNSTVEFLMRNKVINAKPEYSIFYKGGR